MLSIVVSIHNQLAVNQLFYEALVTYTEGEFELIIIDNASQDGSSAYFQSKKEVVLIQNEANYNYPYCQNQGLRQAQYDIVCFFNNDIIVSPQWDRHILQFCEAHPEVDVFSVASNDHLESKEVQKPIHRKWKRIKYALRFLLRITPRSLRWMFSLMYGNWESYCAKRFAKWGFQHIEGYSGSAIIARKQAFDKIGPWDERIQAGDFDLFNRVKKRSIVHRDMLPIQLILGIYFHHFQRMTVKTKYPPFQHKEKMISIEEKWGDATQALRKDIVG